MTTNRDTILDAFEDPTQEKWCARPAIFAALNDYSMSLYEVYLFINSKDIRVAIAEGSDQANAFSNAIKRIQDSQLEINPASPVKYEPSCAHVLAISNENISKIKKGTAECSGLITQDVISHIADIDCQYHGDSQWEANGIILNKDEITFLIIYSALKMEYNELSEALWIFDGKVNDSLFEKAANKISDAETTDDLHTVVGDFLRSIDRQDLLMSSYDEATISLRFDDDTNRVEDQRYGDVLQKAVEKWDELIEEPALQNR